MPTPADAEALFKRAASILTNRIFDLLERETDPMPKILAEIKRAPAIAAWLVARSLRKAVASEPDRELPDTVAPHYPGILAALDASADTLHPDTLILLSKCK